MVSVSLAVDSPGSGPGPAWSGSNSFTIQLMLSILSEGEIHLARRGSAHDPYHLARRRRAAPGRRLADGGRRHPDIAADTGTSPRSVQRWLNAYLDRGLDGLRPRKAPGAKPKLTTDLAPVLRQWVIDGPAKRRLDRANWTYAELADHLFKT